MTRQYGFSCVLSRLCFVPGQEAAQLARAKACSLAEEDPIDGSVGPWKLILSLTEGRRPELEAAESSEAKVKCPAAARAEARTGGSSSSGINRPWSVADVLKLLSRRPSLSATGPKTEGRRPLRARGKTSEKVRQDGVSGQVVAECAEG